MPQIGNVKHRSYGPRTISCRLEKEGQQTAISTLSFTIVLTCFTNFANLGRLTRNHHPRLDSTSDDMKSFHVLHRLMRKI